MALHSRQDRDHVAVRDSISFEVLDPPFMKGAVGADEERLLRWGCLRERVGAVRTKHEKIFSRRNSVKQSRASLFHSVRICFGKDKYLTGSGGAITYTSRFLPPVNRFYVISPDKVKNCIAVLCSDRATEHPLGVVLVEL